MKDLCPEVRLRGTGLSYNYISKLLAFSLYIIFSLYRIAVKDDISERGYPVAKEYAA